MPRGVVEAHLKATRCTLADSVSRAVSRNVGIANAHIAERITANFEQGAAAFLFDEKARFHDATASRLKRFKNVRSWRASR